MFYLFIGQLKTTTGRQHASTGRMNTFGDLRAFPSKSERDSFYGDFYSNNPSVSCVKTNKSNAKSDFFGGMTLIAYEEYVQYVDFACSELQGQS